MASSCFVGYYRITGSQEAAAAEKMVRSLYLPLSGAYKHYPLKPEERVFEGRPDGELTGDCINGWYLSTDIGCAYMCLDGLSRAYRIFAYFGLKGLLEEMIQEFSNIDFCRDFHADSCNPIGSTGDTVLL